MAATISKQRVTLSTQDDFTTAATAALTVPAGMTAFSDWIVTAESAPIASQAGTTKTQTFMIVSIWHD